MNVQWKGLFSHLAVVVAMFVVALSIATFLGTICNGADEAKRCLAVLQMCGMFWVGFVNGYLVYKFFHKPQVQGDMINEKKFKYIEAFH